MRCGDRQSCQRWFERELKQAAERLEFMRDMSGAEFLRRRAGRAAVHADEAFAALTEALLQFDRQASVVQPIAA